MASKKAESVKGSDMAIVSNIFAVPLSDIYVDYAWNARGGEWMKEEGETAERADGTLGLPGLVRNIVNRGQDTPVDLVPSTRSGGKKKWDLVTGFRRFTAILRIARAGETVPNIANWDPKAPTILAKFHEAMSESALRALNLRENIVRQNLTPADVTFGALALKRSGAIQEAIAAELGVSQAYVSQLLTIGEKASPDVLGKWRDSKSDIGYLDMKKWVIKATPGERQIEEFDKWVAARTPKKPGANDWVRAAKDGAYREGFKLGTLERLGLIDTSNLHFEEHVRLVYNFRPDKTEANPKGATAKQVNEIAEAMQKGYDQGMVEPEAEEPEETEAPSTGGKKKKSVGSAAHPNGAAN